MKVLLVDDHALLRDGLALLMAKEFLGLELLQSGSLAQCRAVVEQHPDLRLILLDLSLPDGHGLSALSWISQSAPAARVVALSADESADTVMDAIAAGAAGYVPKSTDSALMLRALRTVLDGGVYLPRTVLEGRGVEHADAAAWRPKSVSPHDLGLSPRQADVLRMLIDGKPNKVISRELGMSESTVKTHLAVIFRKLGANSRTQAVVSAARLGLRLDSH